MSDFICPSCQTDQGGGNQEGQQVEADKHHDRLQDFLVHRLAGIADGRAAVWLDHALGVGKDRLGGDFQAEHLQAARG